MNNIMLIVMLAITLPLWSNQTSRDTSDDSTPYPVHEKLALNGACQGCLRGPAGPTGPVGPPAGIDQWAYIVQSFFPRTLGDTRQAISPGTNVIFDPTPIAITNELLFNPATPDTLYILSSGYYYAQYEVTLQNANAAAVSLILRLLVNGSDLSQDGNYSLTVNPYNASTGANRFTTYFGQLTFFVQPGTLPATLQLNFGTFLPNLPLSTAAQPGAVSASLTLYKLNSSITP